MNDLILDGSKIGYYAERVAAWEKGERIAPITIDMALTRKCNYACGFCYAMLQENDRHEITQEVMEGFLADSAEIGVKGISLVSDGESTISPAFAFTVRRGHELGLDMAVGSNGFLLTSERAEEVLPALTYLRINFSGGERARYAQIMGVKEDWYDRVVENIRAMVEIKARRGLAVTIGMQFVLDPRYADQILPFARLCVELGVDYGIIKHCSDDHDGSLGVDYSAYAALEADLQAAEALSSAQTRIAAKWNKIREGNKRSYQRCYGPPFLIQISGSGLVAPCGVLFNERYRKFHIGNICETRFAEIWRSERYWEVMNWLASPNFNAQKQCGALCLQDMTNRALHAYKEQGVPLQRFDKRPEHASFV